MDGGGQPPCRDAPRPLVTHRYARASRSWNKALVAALFRGSFAMTRTATPKIVCEDGDAYGNPGRESDAKYNPWNPVYVIFGRGRWIACRRPRGRLRWLRSRFRRAGSGGRRRSRHRAAARFKGDRRDEQNRHDTYDA
jgi:hypothetical protein